LRQLGGPRGPGDARRRPQRGRRLAGARLAKGKGDRAREAARARAQELVGKNVGPKTIADISEALAVAEGEGYR